MSALDRILDLLPPPYSVERDALLTGVINVVALELDGAQEDLDRVRLSHWVETAYRLEDLEQMGALFSIPRFTGEVLPLYRERLLARIVAGRDGAVGPDDLLGFANRYLQAAGKVLDATLATGAAELIENPSVPRTSIELARRNGRVPQLFRWRDTNRGLDDTWPSIEIGGVAGRRTSSPVLVNRTTGELIGFRGRLKLGQRLSISASPAQTGHAVATIDGNDVTDALFSLADYQLGQLFQLSDVTVPARLPRLVRGGNDWVFFLLGQYDIPGLDAVGFGVPGEEMQEGVFDESRYDAALFPAGTRAQIILRWRETEPASFVLNVPRRFTVESSDARASASTAVERGLRDAIAGLHGAGVSAAVTFSPFVERQKQRDRGRMLAVNIEPERGPAGRKDSLGLGGHFGEPTLGGTRFE